MKLKTNLSSLLKIKEKNLSSKVNNSVIPCFYLVQS